MTTPTPKTAREPVTLRRLTEEDLRELDDLLERFPESCSLEELDGLFCALAISPETTPPTEWLPIVVGVPEDQWGDKEASDRMVALLMRHWNMVSLGFREDWSNVSADEGADLMYFPLLDDPEESGHPLAEGWARGFRDGMDWLADSYWDEIEQDEECTTVLDLIAALDTGEKQPGKLLTDEERDELISPLAASLQYIFAFWRRWLRITNASREPIRAEDGPGRNDQCPCGSGKKFKKCCGAPEKLH
jgi:uncharacterized protein